MKVQHILENFRLFTPIIRFLGSLKKCTQNNVNIFYIDDNFKHPKHEYTRITCH